MEGGASAEDIADMVALVERGRCAAIADEFASVWGPGFCRERMEALAQAIRQAAGEPKWPRSPAIEQSKANYRAAQRREWGIDETGKRDKNEEDGD